MMRGVYCPAVGGCVFFHQEVESGRHCVHRMCEVSDTRSVTQSKDVTTTEEEGCRLSKGHVVHAWPDMQRQNHETMSTCHPETTNDVRTWGGEYIMREGSSSGQPQLQSTIFIP